MSERFKGIIAKARSEGDPIVFEPGNVFSPRSKIISMDRDFGALYEVMDFVVEKYDYEKMHPLVRAVQWYTPVCVVRTRNGELFRYKNAVILLRDPFKFDRLVKQLSTVNVTIATSELWLDIIASDAEFDAAVGACLQLNVRVILDPSFDRNGQLRRGIPIQPMPISEEERDSFFKSAD
jgi:hypothetical protein